jgi:hypothetical protein
MTIGLITNDSFVDDFGNSVSVRAILDGQRLLLQTLISIDDCGGYRAFEALDSVRWIPSDLIKPQLVSKYIIFASSK